MNIWDENMPQISFFILLFSLTNVVTGMVCLLNEA